VGTIKEVRVPDIGDFKGVDVIEVLVSPGTTVAAEDPLLTLESDKASMEVPSPVAGVVKEIKLKVGDKVSKGDLVLLLEVGEAAVKVEQPVPAAPATPAGPAPGKGALQAVHVPDIGDFKGVDVIEVLVSPGDVVAVEEPLIVLEAWT